MDSANSSCSNQAPAIEQLTGSNRERMAAGQALRWRIPICSRLTAKSDVHSEITAVSPRVAGGSANTRVPVGTPYSSIPSETPTAI